MAGNVRSLTGWIDCDRNKLAGLNPHERVLYFRKRLHLVLLKTLENLFASIGDKHSPMLIFGTTICCSIEALGKFYNGGVGQNHQRFYAFVDKYLHGDFSAKSAGSVKYKEALWKHYRNGLAHGFAVCHGGFEGIAGYFEVRTICGHASLMINPEYLYRDFRSGVAKYLHDLRIAASADQIRLNFNQVFTDVFINGN